MTAKKTAKSLTIEDLRHDDHNPRLRDKRAQKELRRSIRKHGLGRSIVVDKDNNVIAGNGTLKQAAELGKKKIRIVETQGDELVVVKRTDLEGENARAMAIADNRVSDLSGWNNEFLVEELENMKSFEADELGFDDEEYEQLLRDVGDFEEEYDEDPEIREDSRSESYRIVITCSNQLEQEKLFSELSKRGLKLKAKIESEDDDE